MSFSFQHSGGSLPMSLQLGQTDAEGVCPACSRAGLDGTVQVTVPADMDGGATMATCEHGHMVMVDWRRSVDDDDHDADHDDERT